ncbi:MAG TPA: DUF899 domain-containing protein [Opitutaceae bacterium]
MKTPSPEQIKPAGPSQKWLEGRQERARHAPANPLHVSSFEHPIIVSADEWLTARLELLRAEKELTRQYDLVAAQKRELPWVKIDKNYRFDAPKGKVTLGELFGPHHQLIVQHFMFGPGWEAGCKSCSFMTDHIAPTIPHLAARGVAFAAISHAPLAEILPFKARMGWNINWVSAYGTDFNSDYHVSFSPEEEARGRAYYNFAERDIPNSELPGISVFAKDEAGNVYHTYSTFGRGVELVMTTYSLLDIVPKGRDEGKLDYEMSWVRYHDRYEKSATA